MKLRRVEIDVSISFAGLFFSSEVAATSDYSGQTGPMRYSDLFLDTAGANFLLSAELGALLTNNLSLFAGWLGFFSFEGGSNISEEYFFSADTVFLEFESFHASLFYAAVKISFPLSKPFALFFATDHAEWIRGFSFFLKGKLGIAAVQPFHIRIKNITTQAEEERVLYNTSPEPGFAASAGIEYRTSLFSVSLHGGVIDFGTPEICWPAGAEAEPLIAYHISFSVSFYVA